MIDDRIDLLLHFTDTAAKRVNDLIEDKGNKNLKLRIYIIGGGCSGFQYGFILDETVNDGDYCVEKNGAILIVDSLSLQYLIGSIIDYHEEIIGARFVVINPNAKITCSCGSSFNV